MIKYLLVVFISIGFITGCSSISVTNDFNPEADFISYNSFSIYEGVIKDRQLENVPLAKKTVLEAINNEMQKKGLTPLDSASASLIIFAHGGTTEKMNVTDYGYGYGGWWGPSPWVLLRAEDLLGNLPLVVHGDAAGRIIIGPLPLRVRQDFADFLTAFAERQG